MLTIAATTHLSMDVATDCDRGADRFYVRLLQQQIADDIAEFLQVVLGQVLAVLRYVYPPVQFVHPGWWCVDFRKVQKRRN